MSWIFHCYPTPCNRIFCVLVDDLLKWIVKERGCQSKFGLLFFISVQCLTSRMAHIFTVNKEDAVVSHSPSPIVPHSPMHNKSDALCQHRSLHTAEKVSVWCDLLQNAGEI